MEHLLGFSYDHNDKGLQSSITSLDAIGHPMLNVYGYSTVKMTYDSDEHLQTEMYYDTNDEPVPVSNGVYGYKYESGSKIPVDREGNEVFKLRHFLLQSFGATFAIGLLLIVFIARAGRKSTAALLLLYLIFIIYMTLIDRASRDTSVIRFSIHGSIYSFLTDKEVLENIWLFVPLGFLMYRAFVPLNRQSVNAQRIVSTDSPAGQGTIKPAISVILICVIISAAIECTQAFLHIGWCTLSDLICNSLGGMIGVIVGYSLLSHRQNHLRE